MKITNILYSLMLLVFISFFSSCKNEDPVPAANATALTLTTGDLDGDVTGKGGSVTKSFTWKNSLTTADYNMDITSSKGGSFKMAIKDAKGVLVLDYTLTAGQTADSKSGVTAVGTSGDWNVTVTLTDFNGDGSFSLSAGN